ncbi:MAG: hypothetical protein E6Q33_09130 [Neisseriales bacterium]|jgi:hypothetical protein|nr:MAG: hypothetical protein E6Q33_09130 [Neisseriales bacterium]
MQRRIIFLSILLLNGCAWLSGPDDHPPQQYNPTYQYGNTPMGVYVGNPEDIGDDMMGDDMYLPNGQPMGEYQAQSGQQEQQFQYIQGQEELMADQSKQQIKQYNAEQQIGESLTQQYMQQVKPQSGNN